MSTKLFISQPMRDKTNKEIERERQAAIQSIKEKYGDDVEVIDSFFKDAPHDANPLWFPARDGRITAVVVSKTSVPLNTA